MNRIRLRTFDGTEFIIGGEEQPIECFRCGICCMGYHPQLSVEEVERIAGEMGIGPEEFISRYVQVTKIGYLLRQTEAGCVFLTWESDSGKAICGIHPFRPNACRKWEPSLSRRECQAGLAKLREGGGLLLAGDLYEDETQLKRFYASLRALPTDRPKYLAQSPGLSASIPSSAGRSPTA